MIIAELTVQIQRVWRSSFQYELAKVLDTRLRQSALVGVKAALETVLVEELDGQLGFGRYVRLPTGKKPPEQQCSGFFQRRVDAS